MFFEFDHNGNGIFYNVIFREEGIMNIIHYVQGVSWRNLPVRNISTNFIKDFTTLFQHLELGVVLEDSR